MTLYRYPVQQTINGITFTYKGPELDPVVESQTKHPKDKDGDLGQVFVWKEGDTPATHRLYRLNGPSGYLIRFDTRQTDDDMWDYRVDWDEGKFERKHKGGQWEARAPVSELRIKLENEDDVHAPTAFSGLGETTRIEHEGSTCSLVWNPATRRYVRKCV
jgi:hypothetical protein